MILRLIHQQPCPHCGEIHGYSIVQKRWRKRTERWYRNTYCVGCRGRVVFWTDDAACIIDEIDAMLATV